MSERIALLNWKNKNQDYDISKLVESMLYAGIVEWLQVTTWQVSAWYWFVQVTRDTETFYVLYQNTANIIIDTTWTKKVWVSVDQTKIDDGSNNNIDGTGIGSIATWSSYPATNYIPLASITGGVITDERLLVQHKQIRTKKAIPVDSDSIVNLNAIDGNYVHITGNTTITSFWSVALGVFNICFDSVLTLTHNVTSLILPTGTNINTQAWDTMIIVWEWNGNWRVISYQRKNGSPLVWIVSQVLWDTYIAWEVIDSIWLPLRTWVIQNWKSTIANTTNTTSNAFWRVSTNVYKEWQSFITVTDVILQSITLKLLKTWAPTDNIEVRIYASDRTTQIALSSTIIKGVDITTSLLDYVFLFPNIILTAWTTYFIEISRSQAWDNTNYYSVWSSWNNYASWNRFYFVSSWVSDSTTDLTFSISMGDNSENPNYVYKTNSENINKLWFIWFSKNIASYLGNCSVDINWISDTQSGLEVWQKYYLWLWWASWKTGRTIASSTWAYAWQYLWATTSRRWQVFTTNYLTTISSVQFRFCDMSSNTWIINCKIYGPDKITLIATATNTIDVNTQVWNYPSESFVTFNFTWVTLEANTQYMAVFELLPWTTNQVYVYYVTDPTAYQYWNAWYYDTWTSLWYPQSQDFYFAIYWTEYTFDNNITGIISKTPWTYCIPVWTAISSTKIKIDNITWLMSGLIITPTIWTSPYIYKNTTWNNLILSITWGTISIIEISRDNITYYTTAVATNTFVVLGINDYVKITYTVKPIIKAFTI